MGLFTKTDPQIEYRKQAIKEATQHKFKNMDDYSLIMAMLLEMDAGQNQVLANSLLGDEAMKRCKFNPYVEDIKY